MQRIWDISPPVDEASPVYPGDPAYSQRWVSAIGPGCAVNVSQISFSPHTGAHADAPLHYDPQGEAAGALDLLPFLGACRVVHARGAGPQVLWAELFHGLGAGFPPRILIRTTACMPQRTWDPALRGIAPDVVERLGDAGVVLIGVDSASIDPAGSIGLESHQVIRRRRMRVLENLLLDDVAEGDYELIALPLKLTQAEASPVRAILRAL
jgi:arylformamidase